MRQHHFARTLCLVGLLACINTTGCALLMQQVAPSSELRLKATPNTQPPVVVSQPTVWSHATPLMVSEQGGDWVYRPNRALGYSVVLPGLPVASQLPISRRLRPEVAVEAGLFVFGLSLAFTPLAVALPFLNNATAFATVTLPLVVLGGASLGLSLMTGLLFETPSQRLEPLIAPWEAPLGPQVAPVPTP